ncbi:D-alanyl-D-alanine carboxypeptidase family protein [Brevibacillus sp. DP1.3A]|uniref:M15 family metallopeptidase n=1 Tax=Brevibacillus sp. DP1.3A TaxID=2738867 RepID=UPI00156AA58C|nr:M15 family metallopeptidase [Brevibacillus sp. DP1.3A]MED1914564.1 M15 family metallopeptidase [Bacillus thuringiensis]UED74527.1 M15 family metallopeptidase [Brevibacillus sp. DP1.3A]
MKKRVFWLVMLLLFGYIVIQKIADGPPTIGGHTEALGEATEVEHQSIQITKDQIYQGDLLLVNKEYPVHEAGVKNDVVRLSENEELLQGYRLLDHRIEVSESVAKEFLEMIKAAQQDNVSHFILNSGYRGKEEQDQLYAEMGPAYAMPSGYSEHNVGSALDIGSTQMKMERAPEGKWLKDYSWKYGFILRYPKDKVAITGTEFEPWHFRYVGLPHSAIMKQNNFSLEEYLDYLKDERRISVTNDGKIYEINYYPVDQEMTLKVPIASNYEISGDNMGGVIVTSYVNKEKKE